MSGFDANTWYVLRDAANTTNNTLTAGNNTQAAYDPNSPSGIFYAPGTGTIANSQLWQLFQITASSSSPSAYILRSRQIGSAAYLTTAWTTRQCGGGNCATVPVLSPVLNNESLWDFGSWGFSDSTGGAYVYNLGNGSEWRLDVLDDGYTPQLINFDETGRLAQHWTVSAYTTFAASDSSAFKTVPSTATALLAQYTNNSTSGSTASITSYTGIAATGTTTAAASSSSSSNTNTAIGSSSEQGSNTGKSGLSTGAAAGIGVGAACVFFIVCGILGFFFYRRRKSKKVGTTKNPAELSHPFGQPPLTAVTTTAAATTNLRNEKANHVEMPTSEMINSPTFTKTELPHPSDSTRSELMHSPERSRFELEDSSTSVSGTWHSTPTQTSRRS